MLLPDFVILGAMKSGTTTLYEDLRLCPEIFLPDKETGVLSGQTEGATLPSLAEAQAGYGRLYAGCAADTLRGECATTYTMAPHFAGVVDLAREVLNPATKFIYIVREPVSRVVSHHYHDYSSGRISESIDRAVASDPRLLDYTRYASQVAPWIETFGRQNVLLICFEQYMADRKAGLAAVLSFLGISGGSTPEPGTEVHNRSDGKPVAVGRWQRVVRSRLYRDHVRGLIPNSFRQKLAASVLPKAPERPSPPSERTVEQILREVAPEMEVLAEHVGERWWNPAEVSKHWQDRQSTG